MKIIRAILGKIILFLDSAFSPASLKRSPETQSVVDTQTKSLVIYQLLACPFCVKVRREVKRLGLNIQYKNVDQDPAAQKELMAGGKIDQVPCLRITSPDGQVTWMYESSDINTYLGSQFAAR